MGGEWICSVVFCFLQIEYNETNDRRRERRNVWRRVAVLPVTMWTSIATPSADSTSVKRATSIKRIETCASVDS